MPQFITNIAFKRRTQNFSNVNEINYYNKELKDEK